MPLLLCIVFATPGTINASMPVSCFACVACLCYARPLIPPYRPGAVLNAPGHGDDPSDIPDITQGPGATLNAPALETMPPPTIMARGSLWPILTAQPSAIPSVQRHLRVSVAIAQGIATTQADLEILRSGVANITECLESKIREIWGFFQAKMKSERDLQQHRADVARERRVSDHETLGAHFVRLNSAINRIEVIRIEMSRALYDHKKRADRLIADLMARVGQLEAGHALKTASDHSTPSRQDRAQFFDISDHDVDIPRPSLATGYGIIARILMRS